MPRGGARTPNKPAPVSGPGKLSRRTDGGPSMNSKVQGARNIPSGGKYGERKAMAEMQSSAPMAGNPVPQAAPVAPSVPMSKVTPLFAPSQRPDEPVTDGVPVGPGASPQPAQTGPYEMVNKYMPALETMASQPDAPDAFKAFVNIMKVVSKG